MSKGCGKTFKNYTYYDDDDYEGYFCHFKWASYIDYSTNPHRYVDRICGVRNLPYPKQEIDFCQACSHKSSVQPIIVIERLLLNYVPVVIFNIVKQYLY